MSMHGIIRILSTASVLGAMSLGGLSSTTASAMNARELAPADVCAGVSNCRLVATADVDGDGRLDQIGWRQLSQRSVQVRVQTATAVLLTSNVNVRYWWGGGAWAGAARVDNRAGVELLVGSTQGAHTPMYTMLTYRQGGLAVEESPSPLSSLWQVDAADGDYMGWWRHTRASGRVTMTQKIAWRVGEGDRFRGHNVTYLWTVNHWVRTSAVGAIYASGTQASAIGGFHVPGLEAFPGVR